MSEPKPPSDCIAQELRAEVESLVAHGDLPGEQMMRACLEMERLEAEIERLREKNRELNRRATRAESVMNVTAEDCRRQGMSLGRALANVAYDSDHAKLEAIEARCRFPDSVGDLREAIQRIIHPEAESPGPERIDAEPT